MHHLIRATVRIAAVGVIAGGAAAGLVYGIDTDPDLAPTPHATVTPGNRESQTITEDDPRWNCITMGNRVCGPDWVPVEDATMADGSPWLDVLTEGTDKTDWAGCLLWHTDEATAVVCPDGSVTTA